MARKYELINDLYAQIIVDVTKDARAWQSFLRTACRNYKLRFDEQLLLFAQRPDATAVLEIERWNTAFGRWVNKGAKGIAVFEDPSGKSQRLKYYFDITDTHGTKRSREVPVWKMSDEYQSDVTEALKNTFGTLSDLDSLESVIKESVSNAVDDNIDDYIYNFIRNGTGSEIDYISTDEAEEIYKRLVKNSVVYMISERLGADSGLTESDFEGIEYFSTHELLNSIGYATSDIAKMGLGVVAKTVRAIEKENQQAIMPDNNISYNSERSSNYERNHLHNAGRLSDSGSFITGTAGGNTRQMGTDEKGISEAAPQDNVLQSDDELSVNTVPRRNGTESTQTGGRADQRDVGKTGTDRRVESERHDEMGSADEQSQARSSRDSYSADNNERLSNIKPLPSINEQTAFIAEYEAEVTKASAFSVSPERNRATYSTNFAEQIDNVLKGTANRYDDLKVCDTPQILLNVGCEQLPMLYTQHHLRNAIKEKSRKEHTHGLTLEQIKAIPQQLENPVMIYDSLTQNDSIIAVTSEIDTDNCPVIVSIKPNGRGNYELEKVDTNFITSIYGREGFEKHLNEVLGQDKLIYFNKQKSQDLFSVLRLEFPQGLNNLDFNVIIHQSRNIVKGENKEIQQNPVEKAESQKPEIPSDVDKFYVQPEIEQVTWIYYNPDSAAGGQLVYNYLTYDDIFNAVLKDDPMEYLLENCKQETLDRGSAGFDEAVEEFMTDSEDISSREENYVGKLLALTEPRYAIYQLKDGEELSDYRFMNSEYMQAHGMYADRENYNQVYRGRMQESETLEDIFAKFNVNRPEDFHGHSLSVSDIICVKQNGKITAHFVDSVGFKEVPDFTLSREERKVRRTLTDNLTLLADNQLASDEMDTLAHKLFNYEKAQKYSGTSSRWLIGAGMTADKFEDITTRYHNGEDVRAELAKGMYGKLNHIEFFGSKDGIDDVDISATKSEESITFRTKGGFEVTHSWETLGEALITAAKQEYDRHKELDRQFGTQEKTPEIIAESVLDTADFDEIPDDISDKEQKPVAPAWEQRKKSKVKSFDLHPDVPMSERNNFDLRSNPVEQVGKKERFRRNAEAIKVLKECEFENRFATPEEQLVLSKYVGWGGLPEAFDENNSAWANEFAELYTILSPEEYAAARESTLTAFYTPPDVINAIYKAMEQMGFKEGNLLEPSCGIGNFIGMLPKSMKSTKIYGVEIDTISAGIAQQLYQKSSIAAQGFEEVNVPDSFFDGVIGNVPFGDFKVLDKRYDKYNFLIHDYFFAKSLDKLRPGGIMALVTSKGTMDKTNSSVRKYIAQRAELLGAIRLPNNTFKGNAGTEVVSDILFLQKRDRLVDIERDWVHLDTDENGITMNSYFVQNPEMILGEMKTVSGRFGEEVTCVPFENADLSELLSEAVANIHGEISEYEVTDELEEEDNSIPANPMVRNFSYTVVDDKIYFRENSRMSPIEVSATAENRIKGMIGIRDCVRNLIELQSEDYPDEEIKAEQAKLNAVYDTYVKKYGHINSRANKSAFGDDSSFALLSALEIIGGEGDFERKADIFFKRTIMPHKPVTQVDTASEALAVSIGEKAIIDMEYMKRLTGKEEDEIFNDLKGVIFLNPLYNGNDDNQVKYFMADEYLSGNVREKLAIAKKFAEADSSFNINIEALGKVQPEDLTASEISVRLGSTWLPIDVVQQFVHEFLNTPAYVKSSIVVHYSQYTGEWSIDGKSYDRSNVKAYNTYGSSRINAYKIIEETLNLKDVRIFDYVEDIDGSRKPVLNKKETAIAQSKQELIKQGFQEWVWSDPQRRERLCKLYNERFNSIRPREYDGSHIVFSGMNPEITLREHQRNAVAHILYGGNTLLAHAVGAGKTFEMIAAAMESKRLGLCNKSLFVVPNHLTEQWAAEFLQLYPSANILVATKKDFETKNRKRFCGRIATGDYDAVIIGHSQFEKIPMSIERQRASLEQQENEITNGIAELKRNRGENFSIKQLEKAKKAIRQKIEKLNDQSRKDDVVTFEELGVDRLFIDESHYYKNLYLYTKMRNVGGIAQTEAQKSSDLFMKCRYLDELTGGRGTVFATGTPISNSMVELYTIQRYLQYDTLAKNELQHFDAWASTFGETVTAIELTPEGTGYRAKTRFAKFFNLPELMQMFREVADIQTADMLELPVPKANFHNVAVKPSEIQKDMVAKLAERAELVRKGNVDASVDNMLKITNDGRKLALDQRMLNEMLPDFEGSKINACIDNIYRIWEETADKKSAQLVFCDLSTPKNDGTFSVYNDIRKKLIERGIPESEVRFIHEADTDVKKKELFQKTRKGEVRVLLGSTQKMGAGTNVQDRLIALHDIDCPWRPSDLEQRAGRIIRQGNSNPEVEIYRYVTEQTFDAYLYQLVEGKQKFASQIMTSKSPVRSADDIDETALSYAEIKMLATGNPYIKEKMDLDIQVQKLKLLKANYLSEKYNLEDKIIKFYPQKIAALNNTIKALEQDLATAKAHPKPSDDSFVGIEIDGKYISEKADAGKAILEFCKQMNNPDPIAIGKYRGFDMELQFSSGILHDYEIALKGATTQKVSLGEDANGNITRIDNAIGRLSEHIENAKVELKNIQTQYETAQIEVQKPFAQEEELKAKTKRQIEVEKLISSGATDEQKQEDIPDCYYFPATDEQVNALTNASISFEKQTKSDGSIIIRVGIDDKENAETIINAKKVVL